MKKIMLKIFHKVYSMKNKELWSLNNDDFFVRVVIMLLTGMLCVSLAKRIQVGMADFVLYGILFIICILAVCRMMSALKFSLTAGLQVHFFMFSVAIYGIYLAESYNPQWNKWLCFLVVIGAYCIAWSYISLRANSEVVIMVNSVVTGSTGVITAFINFGKMACDTQSDTVSYIAGISQKYVNLCLLPFILSCAISKMLIDLYKYYVVKYEND